MNRDFKGIWISKEIWLSDELTLQEKIFLVEIDSLDNEGGCFATNGYFAEFFGISKTRVSLVIKSLINKGYITSTIIYKEGTKEILKRVLNVCYRPYLTNVKEPIQQKLKDNNTINNTSNNTSNKRVKKNTHLEFVKLTDEEYEKLISKLGKINTDDYIERLNNYLGSKGRQYKSHYHTILSWSRKDGVKGGNIGSNIGETTTDLAEQALKRHGGTITEGDCQVDF